MNFLSIENFHLKKTTAPINSFSFLFDRSSNLHSTPIHSLEVFSCSKIFYYVSTTCPYSTQFVYVDQLTPAIDNTIYILLNSIIERKNNQSVATLDNILREIFLFSWTNISHPHFHTLILIDFLTLVQLVVLRRVFILNDIHPIKALLKEKMKTIWRMNIYWICLSFSSFSSHSLLLLVAPD